MSGIAVQFGAGNIGRGFIAELFHESGYEVVFVDIVPEVLQAINERGAYTIHVVGPDAHDVRIDHIRAIDARDSRAVSDAVADCEIACTAVGVGNLPQVGRHIASGLVRRQGRGHGPLNLLICENLRDACGRLRTLMREKIPPHLRATVEYQTGCVQAVVSRMVPLQSPPDDPDDPLAIRVESYKRLPVDASAIVGELPPIVGVEPVSNFAGYVERKLYTHNCAHATLGYLGYRRGLVYGYEALEDPAVRPTLDAVLNETSEALIRKHGFTPEEQFEYVADLLRRFANRELGDTCYRLARDPIRKLAPDDRLVGAARLCESQGIEPVALPEAIAAALRFDSVGDPSASALQKRILDEGLDAVLDSLCGISPAEPLGVRVREAYQRMGIR